MNLPGLKIKKRIVFLFIILFLLTFSLGLRLIWIQVINSEHYQEEALNQRLRHLKVEPKRGTIFDRNGGKLAVSASSETVMAIPLEVKEPRQTAQKLSRVLDMEPEYIYKRLTKNASAVYIKRKVDEKTANQVRKLNLPGITFTEESKRYYPKGSLACHILGFAGIDSQGLDGVELFYDRYLRGIPGRIEVERDASGQTIPGGIQEYVPPENGYNLYLTIDEVIQYIAERELDRALKDFSISGGTIIVMEPETGSILALANRPAYDPNNFGDFPQKYWRNRAISDGFEPGSTFKIITTATALEEGVVNENDRFVDPGYIIVSGERIKCWKAGGHGSQSFAEVVKNSCNPSFVQVGMRIGKESFYNYINAFGFGKDTGIKLPGEAEGLLPGFDDIGPVELATMSFGHGITVTPIQLVTAVSAVANDGMLMKPRLVKEIRTPDGELVKEIKPVRVRQVISEETARRTLKLLEQVVADGTGVQAQIDGYRIGGKTGTAKHYGVQVYDSSFIGIVPVDNPRFVILVVLYDVTGFPYYGGQTAAPLFRNVALDVIRYLDIPPQYSPLDKKQEETEEVVVPDIIGKKAIKAEEVLRKAGLDVKLVGMKEKVLRQVPLPGARVKEGTTVIIFTEEGEGIEQKYNVTVPDLTGMTVNEALDLLFELGLKMDYNGSKESLIITQDIEPGSRVPGGTTIIVEVSDD
ncbi:stage V sporulation protein D [Halothermothrix orenii]|uniref:Stage V sporulation protein D n=1 Tax=Halothermothrix orenii (strain H 168 / OCM 544 / DSM 9562) TaxID=373903 RepID=B8CWJ0_HALOH|nr:stage V sporulation protein D [Halothermothrix orenii]ACL69659.1 stage V sporulation protein D [Halothermothrix orenii H 168]